MFDNEFIKKVFEQDIFSRFTGVHAETTAYFLVEIIGIIGAVFIFVVLLCWMFYAARIWSINAELSFYKSRKEFSENFDAIRTLFEKKFVGQFFRHQWLEFCETLRIPDNDDQIEPIRNSVRPFGYFVYSDIKWSPRAFSSWPNVFVGIGLLLTFVGLAAAIGEAATGVASQDVKEAQISLQKVLNAASVKFLTSIAGLGVSILLGLLIRFTSWGLTNQIHKMCKHLERLTQYEFSEPIQQKQLKELSEQTTVLKQFTDNFAIHLGDSFEKAIKPINEAIQQQLEKADSVGRDAVERIVHELGDKIQSGTEQQMNTIVQSLEEICKTLDKTSTSLSSNEERIKNYTEQLEIRIKTVQDTLPDLTSAASALSEVVDPIVSTTEKFEAISDTIQEIYSNFEVIQTDLKEVANNMNEAQETMTKAWKDYQSRFENVDQSLERAFRDYGKQIEANQTKVREFVTKLDESFTKATQSMKAAIDDLSETFYEFTDTINKQKNDQKINNE